ncbi:chaperone protein dnaJ-like protein [Perilla frutescens var. frutescens]|nr:chaperone protein dnaJ-like protein [Perilla frutescens var. frutescens]
MALPTNIATANSLNFNSIFPNNQPFLNCNSTRVYVKPLNCTSPQQQADSGILCESCSGRGWLICDFCKGQKTNVKSENNRIYRRCPSCKAIGSTLCSKCKVYKCVTFPDDNDGEELNF